ncbi:MAG TPA: DUF2846 domain-containing protein [Terriglobales bacterium]|jgi:hypothetical protein
MKARVVYAIACVTLLCSLAPAQQPASQLSSTASETNSQATIYVYRYKQFVGKALSPSVYCDENELARMENGRYFVVTLSPGQHVFRSNDKQAGINLDLKPGQKYYIRVEIATGFMKGHGRLVSVAPEQGSYEIKNLKPLDSDKVKDTQHVSLADVPN